MSSLLRFPFLFFQPGAQPNTNPDAASGASRHFSPTAAVACAVAAGAAACAGLAATLNNPAQPKQHHSFLHNARNVFFSNSALPWASLSLADGSAPSVVEPKTGASFPSVIYGSRRLLGVGLRRKNILGLKSIDVYAFGVYADDVQTKKVLGDKYGQLSTLELKENKEFKEDLMEGDFPMTVRLQIVYGKLSIRAVRSAFEQSVGSRLQKFGGPDNKELLQRFTSQFKDEYKIPSGSVIELSREQGHVLRTRIEGMEVGSIQSKLLCRSILDLYIGEDPLDSKAKDNIESELASLIQK